MSPALGFLLEARKQGYKLRAENGCLSGLVQILQQKLGVAGQGCAHLTVDLRISPSYQEIPLPHAQWVLVTVSKHLLQSGESRTTPTLSLCINLASLFAKRQPPTSIYFLPLGASLSSAVFHSKL